ncbi:probable LRR receptor-like serine/threonine-protein kinase At3g47570 [Punica granatum]|nr:probable LRR receptor-like serine/threonine-protein kinase At3g47570 [Punica granatum]
MSNLRGIEVLDVSRNNLSGPIPPFLAELPFLKNLNLSFNMFEGEVPKGRIFGNLSAVSVVGNDKLCGGPPMLQLPTCKDGARKKRRNGFWSQRIVLIISVTVPILLLLVGGIITTVLCQSKRSKRETTPASLMENHCPKLSYAELSQATDRFSPANLVGEGSFGVVYKGVLPSNEQIVAVKVLKLEEKGSIKSFMAECEALRQIRHRNLVKTITSCSAIDFSGDDFKALVF